MFIEISYKEGESGMAKKKASVSAKMPAKKPAVETKKAPVKKPEAEAKAKAEAEKAESDRIFMERLQRHHDELRWLYMELYGNDDMFAELCGQMKWYYDQRSAKLKKLDAER